MKKMLTAKFVESAKPGAKRQEFTDTSSPNLMLIVQPTGSKTWRWLGAVNGKTKKITLGNYPQHDLAAARDWANDLTAQRDAGVAIGTVETPDPLTPESVKVVLDHRTCDWLFDLYMEHEGGSRASAPEKRRMYMRDIRPTIGLKPAADIVHDDLAKIIRNKAKTAPIQSNALQALIRRWFRWAVTHGRDLSGLTEDPAVHIVKLSAAAESDRYLDDYEITVFFQALDSTDYAMNPVLEFVLLNGVRRSEAFEAPWSEFDLIKRIWTIPANRTKNGMVHLLPLAGRSVAILEEQKRRSGNHRLVWPSKVVDDGETPMSGFTKGVAVLHNHMVRIAKMDGKTIEKWSVHDLRRSLSSGMNGLHDADEQPLIPSDIVERVINHKIGGVAGVYNRHEYLAEKRRALKIWSEHLAGLRRAAEKRAKR